MKVIQQWLRIDFSTLYSCILVNRLWCHLTIPLLWENPFSITKQNYNFIGIYLHNLNGDLKAKLNEYKIDDNLFPSNTLFNYPIFLKYLYTQKIISSIERWSKDVIRTLKIEYNSVFKFKRLIHISLLKIFIENEVNIHTINIQFNNYYLHDYIDDMLELMLQNPDFFHNISNLKFHFIGPSLGQTKNCISQIINLHQNLKKITMLGYFCFPLYQLSRNHNHSNTLNTIILFNINFIGITNLDKVFEQLNVLESVHIIYCILDTDFIQQIVNLTKPFKLKSIFLNRKLQIDESLQLLLQKYGDYLENFEFRFDSIDLFPKKQQLFELIIKYCKNIKFLDLTVFNVNNWIIYQLFNLTENSKQNLNYLSIDIINNLSSNIIEFSSTILRNLGQILPLKLEYLNLALNIKYINDFEIFLKNSQNTFIKKLLITNKEIDDDIHDYILFYIKEYIMKKKRVKYLAIISNFFKGNNDLFSFKDEVKEFEFYNIKIQKYEDLVIDNKLKFIEELEDF
ncbi:hypothetical protein C1646_752063 [Rhizophagus diaphanus]|nr:hypothetical protein C1646_752063 [Rhizophagus diaphanus] [Rhizophagus sp. MUCL 43196]